MTVTDYLLHLFYLIDTELPALNLPRLRQRGPDPKLVDSEVLTIELAGEFFGIDTDTGIWRHLRAARAVPVRSQLLASQCTAPLGVGRGGADGPGAAFKKPATDPDPPRTALLTRLRQTIEPVIGQLATRFHAERTWARDLWHLTSRLTRKVLSHTVSLLLNWRAGNPPLQLDRLIDA